MQDREDFAVIGTHRTQEVTYSPGLHGWHPHLHVCFFFARPLSEEERKRLETRLFARWNASIRAALGRECANPVTSDGLRLFDLREVRGARDIAAYLQKVSTEHLRFDSKRSRTEAGELPGVNSFRGLHPFEIAALADPGDTRNVFTIAWREYEAVTHGSRGSTWSKGLRAALALPEEEKPDEQIAREEVDRAALTVFALSGPEFRALRASGFALHLLEAVETGNVSRALELLHAYALPSGLPGAPPGGLSPPS